MKSATDYNLIAGKDISRLLFEKREALRSFRFAVAGSKTRNTKEGKMLRREIARLLTQQGKVKKN